MRRTLTTGTREQDLEGLRSTGIRQRSPRSEISPRLPRREPPSPLGAGASSLGGRSNPPESFATLYLALDRETVVREFFRLAHRMGGAPDDFVPRRSTATASN